MKSLKDIIGFNKRKWVVALLDRILFI